MNGSIRLDSGTIQTWIYLRARHGQEGDRMNSKCILLTAVGSLGAIVVLGQTRTLPPPAPGSTQEGPGVQAPQDARYAEWIKQCKVPPPQRGAGGGARAGAGGPGAGGAPGAAGAARGDAAGRGGDARVGNAAAGPPAPRD